MNIMSILIKMSTALWSAEIQLHSLRVSWPLQCPSIKHCPGNQSFDPGHGLRSLEGNSAEPDGSITNFSLETQTETSRKTSKARTWRKNTLGKVVTSFHLVVGRRRRYKGQELRGDFLWNCGRGPTPLTSPSWERRHSLCFGSMSLLVSQRLSVGKEAEHQVWLLYTKFTAHKTGISIERGACQWRVQLRTQSVSKCMPSFAIRGKKKSGGVETIKCDQWGTLKRDMSYFVLLHKNMYFYKD